MTPGRRTYDSLTLPGVWGAEPANWADQGTHQAVGGFLRTGLVEAVLGEPMSGPGILSFA